MKRLFSMTAFAIVFFCSSFAQTADKVVVIPLGGTHVYIDPAAIVSAYHNWEYDSSTVVLLTVPSGKHFVLTDLVGHADVEVLENDVPKIRVQIGGIVLLGDNSAYPNPITLSSGVVFGPGKQVKATPSRVDGGNNYYGYVTLSGYYY